MSDGDETEEMSYDDEEEDYKYEDADDGEVVSDDNDCIGEDDDNDVFVELGPRKLRKLERQVSYQVHPVKNILANQRVIITEISEMLGIPNHDAALLLRNYKWDKETACDAWCSEQADLRIKIGLPPIISENLMTVSLREHCILCQRKPTSQPPEISRRGMECSGMILHKVHISCDNYDLRFYIFSLCNSASWRHMMHLPFEITQILFCGLQHQHCYDYMLFVMMKAIWHLR